MAKKTRTELSTLALNTNLPDNTTEQITPTTERSQLTDERESVVNYKDDLGGTGNAGKFLTVATDGESLTMVDEPSGVPDWVTFLSRSMRLFTSAVSSSATIEWTYLDALGALTIGGTIKFFITGKVLEIKNQFQGETMKMSGGDIIFMLEAEQLFRIRLLELTHYGDDFNMIAQDVFGASPLYNLNFKGRIDSSSNRYTFSSISGGKENVTEDDKAGFLSFKTGIADGTLTERLRISSGGNVGIGTDSPDQALVVNGSIGLSYNATNSYQGIKRTNVGNEYYVATTSTATDEIHTFTGSSGAKKLTILEGGNILVNTTSSIGGAKFSVQHPTDCVGLNIGPSATGTRFFLYFTYNSVNVGSIKGDSTSTSYNTTSDYRLKENVTPITDALSRINQLKPSRFNFISESDKTVDGFLAHEVQEIIPEAISGEKDAMKDEEFELTPRVDEVTDEKGNVITEAVEAVMETRSVPDYQGIDQSKIVPLLTAAIQEQQTIIDSLINRLEALEA